MLDNKLDFLKILLTFTELHQCAQKVVLYFIDQIITNWTAFNFFFQLHGGEIKATACKEYFICRDISKIVIMFSKTFPQNMYFAYLVCAHPIVI